MKIGSEFDFGENWKSSQNQQNLILEDTKKENKSGLGKEKLFHWIINQYVKI